MKSKLFYSLSAVLKNRAKLFGTWLLLVFFAGGQVVLFAHQHKLNQSVGIVSHHGHFPQQTVSEKCSLCDAMHFNAMLVNEPAVVVHLLPATHYDYKAVTRTFISISLILSTGRAPPVS